MTDARLDPVTVENSLLLLVDYQPAMFTGIGSGDRNAMSNAAVATAKAAQILRVPVVLTSIYPAGNGEFVPEITDLFPGLEVLVRKIPGFDALEDERVAAAVQATGRSKVMISGLWTSMCMTFTALHALRDGHQVYGVIDAAGDATADAHHYGVERMIQAGVVPTTWMPLVSEWMHDWGNPKAGDLKRDVYGRYDVILAL